MSHNRLKKQVVALAALFLMAAPFTAFAVTTSPLASDANTYALWLMDGTVGSAGKKSDSGAGAKNLTENGTLTAGTGQTTPTSNGTYGGFGASKNLQILHASVTDLPTGAQSWKMWVKPGASCPAGSGLAFIVSQQSSTAGTYIGIDGTCHIVGRFSNGGTTKDYTSSGTLSTSAWHYVEIVFTPSTSVDIYIDPTTSTPESHLTTGIPAATNVTSDDFWIGTQQNVTADASFSWTGDIDAVEIESVAETGTDISNYYNGAATAIASYTTGGWWFLFGW